MRQADREKAGRFKARLQEMLGARLLEVTAFGSRARGVHGPESDLDLLVVVDVADRETKRDIAYLSGDFDIDDPEPYCISTLVMDPPRIEELRKRERRLIHDIDRDGVRV